MFLFSFYSLRSESWNIQLTLIHGYHKKYYQQYLLRVYQWGFAYIFHQFKFLYCFKIL